MRLRRLGRPSEACASNEIRTILERYTFWAKGAGQNQDFLPSGETNSTVLAAIRSGLAAGRESSQRARIKRRVRRPYHGCVRCPCRSEGLSCIVVLEDERTIGRFGFRKGMTVALSGRRCIGQRWLFSLPSSRTPLLSRRLRLWSNMPWDGWQLSAHFSGFGLE